MDPEDSKDPVAPGQSGGVSIANYQISYSQGNSNGNVVISHTDALPGIRVKITANPNENYELSKLTVTDATGNDIKLTEEENGAYTFIMPASKVKVEASFAEKVEQHEDMTFTDVSSGAYYYEAIKWAFNNKITFGTSDTTFSPNNTCTRAETLTFLWRAIGSPEPKSTFNPFEDVDADAFYYNAVLWAVENGITAGTSPTTFSPDAIANRSQALTFQWRAAGRPKNSSANPFEDVKDSHYFADAVMWAVENSITYGTGESTFSPEDPCIRAQIVTFLHRYLGE